MPMIFTFIYYRLILCWIQDSMLIRFCFVKSHYHTIYNCLETFHGKVNLLDFIYLFICIIFIYLFLLCYSSASYIVMPCKPKVMFSRKLYMLQINARIWICFTQSQNSWSKNQEVERTVPQCHNSPLFY